MIKKAGILFLSIFGILFVGTTFANPIAPERYYVCSMFENVEIDNYRVVIQNGSSLYEPIVNSYSCLECGERPQKIYNKLSIPSQKIFLLDKSIDIDDITDENIESKSISITSTYCSFFTNIKKVYKIVNSGNNYTILDRTEHYKIKQEKKIKAKNFLLSWLFAVIIETIVLFVIAKLFRKEDKISNKKLILFGVIPTTVTLPLLRFVLPLIIEEGVGYTIIGELLVTIIEAIIIKYGLKISWGKAILVSIICNIASYGVGLLIL